MKLFLSGVTLFISPLFSLLILVHFNTFHLFPITILNHFLLFHSTLHSLYSTLNHFSLFSFLTLSLLNHFYVHILILFVFHSFFFYFSFCFHYFIFIFIFMFFPFFFLANSSYYFNIISLILSFMGTYTSDTWQVTEWWLDVMCQTFIGGVGDD